MAGKWIGFVLSLQEEGRDSQVVFDSATCAITVTGVLYPNEVELIGKIIQLVREKTPSGLNGRMIAPASAEVPTT